MKILGLGHVALKVTDMERSKQFYHSILGMPYSGDHEGKTMAFFRADEHQNLALFLADSVENTNPPLDHIAFHLHGGVTELHLAQAELESNGIVATQHNHKEVQSLYLHDPDGNQIELYIHNRV